MGAEPDIPELAAKLLIIRARRRFYNISADAIDDQLERIYELVFRVAEAGHALYAVRADIRAVGDPTYATGRALVAALAALDGDVAAQLADLVEDVRRTSGPDVAAQDLIRVLDEQLSIGFRGDERATPPRDSGPYGTSYDGLMQGEPPEYEEPPYEQPQHGQPQQAPAQQGPVRPGGLPSVLPAQATPRDYDDADLDIPDFLKNDPEPKPKPRRKPKPSSRFLVAALPGRAPVDAEISLIVRISLKAPDSSARATSLWIPPSGRRLSILAQAPAGLAPVTALEQQVVVPEDRDSEPLRFAFRAQVPGLHRVRVMAFAGGTFLAELETEVSVEPGGPFVDTEPVVAKVDSVAARRGDVTLQVRSDGENTFFQLLSDTYLFEPVLVEALAGGPPAAVERTIATLRQLTTGQGPYGSDLARRWMQETGIGLWADMVPAVIKEQFWQLREQITSFTIATTQDVIPWELLYPLRPGSDDGFMIEQFPVLRRVFGQQRAQRVRIAPCTYVLSERSPANARQEIDMLASVIGSAGIVDDLGGLLDKLDATDCGPLHFACHNSFSADAGSAIAMNGGPFVPALLNSATIRHSLASTSPLIFLNACRTAGTVTEYHRMTGWAQQFMAAGAGAFVGTLWPVRSDSASAFARSFYTFLDDGEPLGRAALLARRSALRDGPDPTWLAYTVYGDPQAVGEES
ncbi:MAG TPA: CHAT domain-containing protein [Pseudonocardiaceae bacterium]|nr:CHAT domain-containing protein [Pseudonocardiaceae bacterium]